MFIIERRHFNIRVKKKKKRNQFSVESVENSLPVLSSGKAPKSLMVPIPGGYEPALPGIGDRIGTGALPVTGPDLHP